MSTRARTAAGLTVAGATAVAMLMAGLWPDPTASTTSSPPSGTSLPSVPPSPASDASPGAGASGEASGPALGPEPTAAPMDFDLSEEDREDVEAYPVWDAASRDQATAAAAATMAAFTRPSRDSTSGSDPEAWWAALMPHLTPTARQTYALVDPAHVPPTLVTGPGVLVEPAPGATAFLATVHVPTDVGSYEVLLARTGHDAPWLAELITPPAELSGPVTAPPVATT